MRYFSNKQIDLKYHLRHSYGPNLKGVLGPDRQLNVQTNLFSPFHVAGLFLYPLKLSESQTFFMFKGYRYRMKSLA